MTNFVPPMPYTDHRVTCIDLVADILNSCNHFASSVATKLERKTQIVIERHVDDYPTDILQNAIEAALQAGIYPVLTIERFHAFAKIRDGGMASVLSLLRTLESNGQLTTLAFSPMSYDAIRREMDSEQPFLNSVYGDTHDEVVMAPLTRDEFLMEALIRGVDATLAHRLYNLGGGPDAIFLSLLDMSKDEVKHLVEQCAERMGSTIDSFLARAFPELSCSDPLIDNLGVGQLSAAQQASLLAHPFSAFLCKRNSVDEVICSTPIIARRILSRGLPLWGQYGMCVAAIEAEDYATAAKTVEFLNDKLPRLVAFRELVILKATLDVVPDRGLLGVDWFAVSHAIGRLHIVDPNVLKNYAPWLKIVAESVETVMRVAGNQRLQVDIFTKRAEEKSVRLLLLFMMDGLVRAASRFIEPSACVNALVNLPEAILQTLALGFCAIDFAKAPKVAPVASYDSYFSGQQDFVFPAEGYKLTLGNLLVIIPAVLAEKNVRGACILIDPKKISRLQQALVDTVRNPASHTIVDFKPKDARFLKELCRAWIDEWCQMEGFNSVDELPIRSLAPCSFDLRALVTE
ncbi:MAG: hypothetical protein ABF719_08910 [Acetobacter sp.]|uniref:hypothetical protein n=1 Tax=Acetobacter sp. TaxID=440 RepID=UPI0039EB9CBB